MGGVAAVAGSESFGGAEFAAALEEFPPIGISVAHVATIDAIDIDGEAGIVAGGAAVRPSGDGGDIEGVAFLSKDLDGA